MRVTSLLPWLIIAATTSVSAQPPEATRGERVPFHTLNQRHRPRGDNDWVRLATPTPTRHGTEYVVVGRDAGWFRTLRIEATAGSVYLRRIRVLSPDGARQTYNVNLMLDRHRPFAYVDLGGPRRIDQLVITTARRPAGAYAIYGTSGRPGRVIEVSMR